MSNIDLNRLITAERKAEVRVTDRSETVRAICRARILAVLSISTQQNMAQALSLHAVQLCRGTQGKGTRAAARLTDANVDIAAAAQGWIAEMRARCAVLEANPDTDPADDGAWPAPPTGIENLAARF